VCGERERERDGERELGGREQVRESKKERDEARQQERVCVFVWGREGGEERYRGGEKNKET